MPETNASVYKSDAENVASPLYFDLCGRLFADQFDASMDAGKESAKNLIFQFLAIRTK